MDKPEPKPTNDRCFSLITDFSWCKKHNAHWPATKDKCEKAPRD